MDFITSNQKLHLYGTVRCKTLQCVFVRPVSSMQGLVQIFAPDKALKLHRIANDEAGIQIEDCK